MRVSQRFRAGLIAGALLCGHFAAAQSVDMRTYFPQVTNNYRWADGTHTHTYAWYYMPISPNNWAGSLYLSYMNQNLPGAALMIQQKIYSGCTVTYAFMLKGGGADQRVQEIGDWYDTSVGQGQCNGTFSVLSYRTFPAHRLPNGTPTGLNWSGPWGLDTSWAQWNSMRVYNGISPHSYAYVNTYASPGLIEILPTWNPKYGRDENGNWVANPNKTYYNVARVRFYHGTTQSPNQCTNLDPSKPYSAYYYHGANHSSMGLEFYFDQTHGLLQETFLYAEHPQSGRPACDSSYPALASSANLQQALAQHEYYIDN